MKLLEATDGDLPRILKQYEINPSRLTAELTRALDKEPTGHGRAPAMSFGLVDWVREAWTLASLEYGAGAIRSGHMLVALLTDRNLSARARQASAELAKIPSERLQKDLPALVAGSAEDAAAATGAGEPAAPGQQPAPGSKTPSLDQF